MGTECLYTRFPDFFWMPQCACVPVVCGIRRKDKKKKAIILIQIYKYCFHTGHEADYLNLAVRDGGLSLTMGLGNGKQEMHIKPSKTRFDDHQWHKLTVRRRIQEVNMCILIYNYFFL